MNGFVNPWWLLALAIVPWIRWWHRRQAPLSARVVPAIFLWQDSPPGAEPGAEKRPPDPAWRRRALIAALLATALATPFANQPLTTVTVWLDDSLSMRAIENGESRLAIGERLLERELEEPDFGMVERRLLSSELPERLDDTSSHWLVTDGASERTRGWARDMAIDHVIQVGSATENLAVTRIAARRNLDDHASFDLLVAIANTGNQAAGIDLELLHGDRISDRTTIAVAPGAIAYWQTTAKNVRADLTARLESDDVLQDDDSLTLPFDALRQQETYVDRECGPAIRRAIATHPALSLSNEPVQAGLHVQCAAESGDATATALPVRVSVHDTDIDINDPEATEQPEFAVRFARLVDAAMGRQLLDAVTAESRDVAESVIRPQSIGNQDGRGGTPLPRIAKTSLSPFLIFAALIVLLADTVLLLRDRVRAASG